MNITSFNPTSPTSFNPTSPTSSPKETPRNDEGVGGVGGVGDGTARTATHDSATACKARAVNQDRIEAGEWTASNQ